MTLLSLCQWFNKDKDFTEHSGLAESSAGNESLTIVLTDSEEVPPKLKKKLTEYFKPAHQSTLHCMLRIVVTCNASTWSVDTGTLGPGTQTACQIKQNIQQPV